MQKKFKKKIIISDATLRDGNHAIKHQINKSQLILYCKAAESAGIDIVEVGHGNGIGASSIQVGLSNLKDTKMLEICRKILKKTKLGIHVIPGFATKKDIDNAISIGVDVFRIASHCTEAYITQRHIEHIRKKNKKVYGVFSNWDDADDGLDGDVNDMNIAQVGTFIIRVHKDVTVEAGDLLVSNGDGTAKKQDDDIIRSKTVAKVNSNIKVETYSDGSYTVPCTLHC